MSAFDDDMDHQDLIQGLIWDDEDDSLEAQIEAATKAKSVRAPALATTTDDALGEDFWDNPTFTPDGTPQAQQDIAELVPYSDALFAMFPQGNLFVGLAKGTKPLACTVLGSSVVSFRVGEGRWIRTIGTRPLPNINWREPHNGPRPPPTALMAARNCKSPQEFRMWLNWVATKIMEGGSKYLKDAVHQDNFVPDLRFALQAAFDLMAIGATAEMVYAEAPPLHWTPDTVPHSYSARILRGGKAIGSVKLRYQEGHWRYGALIDLRTLSSSFDGCLTFKHQAPAHVGIDPHGVEVACGLAAKLLGTKTLEWLTTTACNHPELRGS